MEGLAGRALVGNRVARVDRFRAASGGRRLQGATHNVPQARRTHFSSFYWAGLG